MHGIEIKQSETDLPRVAIHPGINGTQITVLEIHSESFVRKGANI